MDTIERLTGLVAGRRLAVVCGGGQNGGDGFVVARHLLARGAHPTVFLTCHRKKLSGDAVANLMILDALMPTQVVDASADSGDESWDRHLDGMAVVVDAIFGTGLRDDVTGVPAIAIRAINRARAFRVAVDVPSGRDADTGQIRGVAVAADVTVTMAARKIGLLLDPDVGAVQVVDLGAPIESVRADVEAVGPLIHWQEEGVVRALLPPIATGAHKGARGHLLAVAGSTGKTGAAWLVGRAALRAGAGMVTLASTRSGQMALDAKVIEAMTVRFCDGEDPGPKDWDTLLAICQGKQAVALGPGIPTGEGMAALVKRAVAELRLPMVIDADGLNLLGADLIAVVRAAKAPRVLTPHPGEMARLLQISIAQVQSDRLGHARRLAAATGAVVLCKGARTVIARPDGVAFINPAANSSLATAGTGDVLTGVLGAMLAQGLTAEAAARVAVFAHGRAADIATKALGARTLVAGDLPDAVAQVLG